MNSEDPAPKGTRTHRSVPWIHTPSAPGPPAVRVTIPAAAEHLNFAATSFREFIGGLTYRRIDAGHRHRAQEQRGTYSDPVVESSLSSEELE